MTTYLLGAIVRAWRRCTKGGIDKWERGRARSIAAASAPLHGEVLAPEDVELVEAHHEIVVEYRTADQPVVPQPVRRRHVYKPPSPRQIAATERAFAADPLYAPIPGRHRMEEPELFAERIEEWFAPVVAPSSAPFPVRPQEPEPLELEGPTGVFPRDWIQQVMAGGAR